MPLPERVFARGAASDKGKGAKWRRGRELSGETETWLNPGILSVTESDGQCGERPEKTRRRRGGVHGLHAGETRGYILPRLRSARVAGWL